jgi:hypothetical protein
MLVLCSDHSSANFQVYLSPSLPSPKIAVTPGLPESTGPMEVSTGILPIAPAGDRTSGWPFNGNNLCRYAYLVDAHRSAEAVMPMPTGHSVRSTRIGSTAAARRAGRKQASNAAANRIIPTAPNAE